MTLTFRGGRLPAQPARARLRLGDYLTGSVPTPPASIDWQSRVASWPMFSNDSVGDCTCAAVGHMIQAETTYGQGTTVTVADQDVLTAYEKVSGYNPADPSTDQGAVIQDVLAYWQKTGMAGHKIVAYASVDVSNPAEIKAAIDLFGAVDVGFNFPTSAMAQFNAGQEWDVVKGSPIEGGHCLAPETRVLTDDLRWVPVGSLEPGDGLVAFEEQPSRPSGKRRFKKATVESTERLTLPCYELEFDDGTTVTAAYDHLWLTATGKTWVRTDELRAGSERSTKMFKLFDVWDVERSWEAGYLAAAFDGEGWLDGNSEHIRRLGFAQRSNAMLETTEQLLKERGFAFRQYLHSSKSGYGTDPVFNLALNGRRETVRFLGMLRPQRLLDKFHPDRLGSVNGSPHVRLVRKTFVGDREVVALATSTRTYIAEGLPSHNCVPVGAYAADGTLTCVTWGALQRMSPAFWTAYVDEAWVVITQDWLNAKGLDPQGLNLYQLGQDYAALTGKPNPIPAPQPQPAPTPTPAPAPSPVPVTAKQIAAGVRAYLTSQGV